MDDEAVLAAALRRQILLAFDKAVKNTSGGHSSPIGSLQSLSSIFPLGAFSSLSALGSIEARTRSASLASSLEKAQLVVLVGAGEAFATTTRLHEFYNTLLDFDTPESFHGFMKDGFSLVVLSAKHHAIVAAVSFRCDAESIFINAIGVSKGKHKHGISLSKENFLDSEDLTQLLAASTDGSFQRLGLGQFLIALVLRFAIIKCGVSPSVYLKANKNLQAFYTDQGFRLFTPTGLMPADIFGVIPGHHYATDDETILLVNSPVTTVDHADDFVDSDDNVVATLLADLKRKSTGIADEVSEYEESVAEADISTPTTTRNQGKKDRARAKKARQARTKAAENLDIATSDTEEGPDDYSDNEAGLLVPARPDFRVANINDNLEPSHQLSQNEVWAHYHDGTRPLALNRLKVIRQALHYHSETLFQRALNTSFTNKKFNVDFSHQQFLDLAAVADLNRSIKFLPRKLTAQKSEVGVMVSSYIMPDGIGFPALIADRRARLALSPAIREVVVSVPWLLSHSRPEVARFLDDSLLGTKVARVHGNNSGTDALSLSFSGTGERDTGFVALPQGHGAKYFCPVPRRGKVEKRLTIRQQPKGRRLRPIVSTASIVYYDVNGNATEKLRMVIKKEASKFGLAYAPPPPKADTQVVKLKWVPTRITGQDPKVNGIWHGAIAMKTGHSTLVLQECGLLPEWVEQEFSDQLRQQCVDVATVKGAGGRNPNHYLLIPAGDVHDAEADPPPASELEVDVGVKYQQGSEDTCLRLSMASALAAMGFGDEAKELANDFRLAGSMTDLLRMVVEAVKTVFSSSNLVMKRINNRAFSVDDVSKEDSSWPIVLLLQTSDGCYGSHAITTWKNLIFDSNCDHALRWSQKSLDWCSGKDSSCTGFSRVYRICPASMGPIVGKHVHPRSGSIVGWIMRLPSKHRKGYHVRYADGATENISEEEAKEGALVRRCLVGGLELKGSYIK